MNFAGVQKKVDRKSVKNVTEWVKQHLTLLGSTLVADQQIMATEVECNQPDCVPIETLVILVGLKSKWMTKIMKPISDVTYEDVCAIEIPLDWDSVQPTLPALIDNVTLTQRQSIQENIEVFLDNISNPDTRMGEIIALKNFLVALELSSRVSAEDILPVTLQTANDTADFANKTTTQPISPEEIAGPISTLVSMKPRENIGVVVSTAAVTTYSTSNTTSTFVKMVPSSTSSSQPSVVVPIKAVPTIPSGATVSSSNRSFRVSIVPSDRRPGEAKERHSKGTRQRGCPCCDPDNIDNIVDKMMYMDA